MTASIQLLCVRNTLRSPTLSDPECVLQPAADRRPSSNFNLESSRGASSDHSGINTPIIRSITLKSEGVHHCWTTCPPTSSLHRGARTTLLLDETKTEKENTKKKKEKEVEEERRSNNVGEEEKERNRPRIEEDDNKEEEEKLKA